MGVVLLENGSTLLIESGGALLLEATARDVDYDLDPPETGWRVTAPTVGWTAEAPEA